MFSNRSRSMQGTADKAKCKEEEDQVWVTELAAVERQASYQNPYHPYPWGKQACQDERQSMVRMNVLTCLSSGIVLHGTCRCCGTCLVAVGTTGCPGRWLRRADTWGCTAAGACLPLATGREKARDQMTGSKCVEKGDCFVRDSTEYKAVEENRGSELRVRGKDGKTVV